MKFPLWDAVAGDLQEERALRSQTRPLGASVWYWNQVLRSIVPLTMMAARRGRWLHILGAAFVAYVLESIVEGGSEFLVVKWFVPSPAVRALFGLCVGLPAMAAAGYLAARLQRGAAAVLAAMIAAVVIALMVTMTGSEPLWYQLGFLFGGPAASLAGGALVQREIRLW